MPVVSPWFAHYEVGVPHTVEVPDKLLQDILADSVRNFPDHRAVTLALKYLPLGLAIRSRMTYRELDAASDRFAAALQGLGIKKGDRVGIMLPNIPQVAVAFYGIVKAGAIAVNINPTYTPPELKHILGDSGARAVVLLSGLVARLESIRAEVAVEQVIVTDVPDTLGLPFRSLAARQVRAGGLMQGVTYGSGVHAFAALVQGAPARPQPVALSQEDVVLFQYTGGPTGVPKAAMLTHHNLVANCTQMAAWIRRIEVGKEKMLAALPTFHVYGMSVGLLLGITIAAEVVMVPDPRNTAHIIEVISKEKCSIYPGVPAMYIGILNHPKAKELDIRSIKICVSGGSALPVEVARQFDALTGGRLIEGFGMTESSPLAVGSPIYGESRAGSIGLPFPSTDAAVCALIPDEKGEYPLLGVGEEGELVIKGPQVMKGYWQMPDETAKTLDADGWLHTGDIAKMDADGYFYIVDRKKDLIIASGFNIVPREVEEVLFQHPKVLDATVVGIPDPKRGETVKAYVVLKEGQTCTDQEIRAFCKEQLAPYKVPASVEFRAELPKSQAGKVLRRLLVEEEKEKQARQTQAE